MPNLIEGTVVSINAQGSLVTDITSDRLRGVPRDENVSTVCDEHETIGIFDIGHDQPMGTFIAVLGESGNLELEIVGISAAEMLSIRVGEKVEVKW